MVPPFKWTNNDQKAVILYIIPVMGVFADLKSEFGVEGEC